MIYPCRQEHPHPPPSAPDRGPIATLVRVSEVDCAREDIDGGRRADTAQAGSPARWRAVGRVALAAAKLAKGRSPRKATFLAMLQRLADKKN
jgi:hypothetical protein